MEISKQLLDQSKKAGKEGPDYLQLGEKTEKGVKSTGPHTVKVIKDEAVKGKDYHGNERAEVRFTFEEGGVEKVYRVPAKNKNGGVHYFVKEMASVEPNEEIVLEMKRTKNSSGNAINVINVERPNKSKEQGSVLDTVDIDEDANQQEEPEDSQQEEEEPGIDPSEIPFN